MIRWILAAALALSFCIAALPPVRADENGASQRTLAGIDVLQRDGFRALQGRRVGLISNHTGRSMDGRSTARLLYEADGVELAALFSPEHGLEGRLDIPEIADSEDPETGLRVFSLYGETRRPNAEMLKDLDTLVFDIQDIGSRFYTYISTMGLAMEAAAESNIRFVVLDRPNPINGTTVAGPVADEARLSFVAWHRIPVRHGMTAGELARMFRSERALDLDLEVIAAENWRRADYFDATGLLWVNPSPNMRSLAQALLYPGIGLLETTNLSVGRGTDTPFEVLGAPWLDGRDFAWRLNRLGLPGVVFVPVDFTPDASKFAGERCGGINILVVDRARFQPVRTGLELALMLRGRYPDDWDMSAFNRLLVNEQTFQAVRDGMGLESIEAGWRRELARFLQRREAFLIYP
jgi:uncharacterized protein YbbC (DUF1343 family)